VVAILEIKKLTITYQKHNQMMTETKLRGALVVCLLGILGLQFFFFENIRKTEEYKITVTKQIDSLNKVTDSLQDELFNEKADAGRHELTRDEIFHKYPKVGEEYDKYYQHETE
jgi:hypothetical protein